MGIVWSCGPACSAGGYEVRSRTREAGPKVLENVP